MRLWAGQTISEFGTWLGALSLLAILNLDATPAQMGTLETLKAAPAIVIGLFAGVWVDRLRRRPLLIAADWGRALMLGSVVLLAFLGGLHMTWLYVVAFLVGGLAVLFDVATTRTYRRSSNARISSKPMVSWRPARPWPKLPRRGLAACWCRFFLRR